LAAILGKEALETHKTDPKRTALPGALCIVITGFTEVTTSGVSEGLVAKVTDPFCFIREVRARSDNGNIAHRLAIIYLTTR
jgi:hypothetical protein